MSDTDTFTIKTFADAEVALAESLPGYESRPQQQALALRVEDAIDQQMTLLAEAGCGTGKSLGYLIPAITSGKKVVISTATKALQDQVANKDLPFLAEHLGIDFSYAILKGRSNYVCQAKLVDADTPATNEVQVWIGEKGRAEGFDGERDNLPVEVTDIEWRGMTVSSDECPGKNQCPFGDTCYAEAAKQRAKDSDIVVVNHALFFTDLLVREMTGGTASMLGEYDLLVADEAHEFEEWASKSLGTRFSEGTVKSMTAEVRSFVLDNLPADDPSRERVLDTGSEVEAALLTLWDHLGASRPEAQGRAKTPPASWRLRLSHVAKDDSPTLLGESLIGMANVLGDYAEAVSAIDLDKVGASDLRKKTSRKRLLTVRAHNTARRMADVVIQLLNTEPTIVPWVEIEKTKRGDDRLVIQAAPIEVGDILHNMVWSKTPGILVSATMSVNGSFDYIAQRLGITDFEAIDVGTPFDYSKQAALYVPADMPSPKERAAWENLSVWQMGELVKSSEGRALLLFTSTKQMKAAFEQLNGSLPYTCLMQGQQPNKVLAERFMDDTHSVLFATRSFFTGVDFQGEACSLVVIDKLPFPVPDEPVTEARCEKIENRGGNAFRDYTIPIMSLILKQGFGRLIRHRNDRGVVAILDSRLTGTGYGRKIMDSLPPALRLTKLAEVQHFYKEGSDAK